MSDFDSLKPDGMPEPVRAELPPDLEFPKATPVTPQVDGGAGASGRPSLDTIMRIPVSVKIVLGSASMPVAALLKLGRGALIPLDRKIGEPVDVVVNDRVVARGEVVVMEDDPSRFGISLTEVVGPAGPDKLP
jgi:flagellar motor switch protein FliN/FliY